jgi:hypothetical protein
MYERLFGYTVAPACCPELYTMNFKKEKRKKKKGKKKCKVHRVAKYEMKANLEVSSLSSFRN